MDPVVRYEDSLEWVSVKHSGTGTCEKKVLLAAGECSSNLQMANKARLPPGGRVEDHMHPAMEEFFCILSGGGVFRIEGIAYPVREGAFIYIPAAVYHGQENTGPTEMSWINWGVSTDNKIIPDTLPYHTKP